MSPTRDVGPEDLCGGSEAGALARGLVEGCAELAEVFLAQAARIGVAGQPAAQALVGMLNSSFLPWRPGIAEPGLRAGSGLEIRPVHEFGAARFRGQGAEELNELGIRVGQCRVGRLMRQNGIQTLRSRKFKRTTDSDHAFSIAPNLLQQDFTASGLNQKWAGDISYVWTREGWVYLAVIIDLISRRVVGWAIGSRMKQDPALRP